MLSPCLFNLHAEYIMRNSGLDEAQAGIRLLGEISITSDMQMTLPLWQNIQGFPGSSDGKPSAYNARNPGLIPGSGRSSGE